MPPTTQTRARTRALDTIRAGTTVGFGNRNGLPAKGAGRPTVAELERRMEKVAQIATELFVRNGYAETSLIEIAKQAGVATRTIYQHLGDKEALFREVILGRKPVAPLHKPRLEPDDTLYSALDRIAWYIYDFSMRPHSIDLMRLMIAESRRFPDLIADIANARFDKTLRYLSDMFGQLSASGMIPEGNHDEWASLYIDVILGAAPVMVYTEWNPTPLNSSYMTGRIEFFMRGAFGPVIASSARNLHVNASGSR